MEQWSKYWQQMTKMWKLSWDPYLKAATAMQEQSDRMLDLMLQQIDISSEEARKQVREWLQGAREVSKVYRAQLEAIQENIKKLEEMLEQPAKPKQAKQ